MIDKNILSEIGTKKGLKNREHIEKDYFQDLFLFNLYKKSNKFVFKGGTALYKIHKLPRFSEDLDFSLVEPLDQKAIEGLITETVKNIKEFEIKNIKTTKDSLLIKIGIGGILTKYNTLRVDINTKNKILGGFDIKNLVSDYIDINPFSIRVLKPEEIISEKIHSIFARKKARDLFDLFFLLRMSNFSLELVNEKLKIFNMKFDFKEFSKKLDDLQELWEKELKPFVLTELFAFEIAKSFVLEKINKEMPVTR